MPSAQWNPSEHREAVLGYLEHVGTVLRHIEQLSKGISEISHNLGQAAFPASLCMNTMGRSQREALMTRDGFVLLPTEFMGGRMTRRMT